MIHYHGTPVSGPRADVAKFLNGRHALIPFFRPDDVGPVSEFCQSWIIDNSAFSVWRKGGQFEAKKYYDFVDKWRIHPSLDFCFIPDVIDGTEKENDYLLEDWPFGNFLGCPVYHLHEPVSRLKKLCKKFHRVALGSSGQYSAPNSSQWWKRINEVLKTVCDDQGRPPVKFHGLRMLNPEIFTKLPFASADSCNAARNCNNHKGPYQPASVWQRASVIADRIENQQSPAIFTPIPEQKELFLNCG